MFMEYENIALREGIPNTLDVIVSTAAVFLTLEATRHLDGSHYVRYRSRWFLDM